MAHQTCLGIWESDYATKIMVRLATFILGFYLAACSSDPSLPQASGDKPIRIVSLDYCADQYVLKLADPEQILAVSPGATKDFSYMRDEATSVPTVRPVAEDVLILKPDLVVRSYGGGPNAAAFFERAGIPVLQLGWTSQIDGEEAGSIPFMIQHVAKGLGQEDRGDALISNFRDRLSRLNVPQDDKTVFYMSQGGVTTGPGSLIHEMIEAAGLENFEQTPGWHSLPLERLAYEQPDLIAAAFFEKLINNHNAWTASNHPIAQRQLSGPDVIPLQGAWTACGGWFILDAIEALTEGASGS